MRQKVPGQRFDAREAPVVGQAGELPVVGAGQVPLDVAGLGLDQVEVVEQPFGRGRDGVALVHVLGDQAVGLAQAGHVRVEAAQVLPGAAPPRRTRSRMESRQLARTLLELFDSEQTAGRHREPPIPP